MLKQSPNRNQRSKGFKVKHFLQICLLLVICIWLLNQLKHSYDKKNSYDSRTGEELEKVQREHENIKLGRKDLLPRVDETTLEGESKGDKAELEEGIEEIKPDEVEGSSLIVCLLTIGLETEAAPWLTAPKLPDIAEKVELAFDCVLSLASPELPFCSLEAACKNVGSPVAVAFK